MSRIASALGDAVGCTVDRTSNNDSEALEETAYLLRSPKNARRLFEAIAELEAGGGITGERAE